MKITQNTLIARITITKKTMNKKLQIGIIVIVALFSLTVNAQSNKCATMQHLQKSLAKDPTLKQRMLDSEKATSLWIANHTRSKKASGDIIVIPTVVHVIWKDPLENVSEAQIMSQIDVLNEDFRLLNADSLDDQHPFWPYTIDAEIEFCLARQDPDGKPTTGITRTKTNVTAWDDNNYDNIKSTANGGRDNWDPTEYLNIYVVNLDGTTLGFATFPDELDTDPDLDGIVIRHEAFGTEGTAGTGDFSVNDGGRTGTHEVGHWLNLRHIWGDTTCGDDFVIDTKPAKEANYDCPAFPRRPNNQCGSDKDGEMFMNYMDYVDDDCMNMFTGGQAVRMHAALYGPRFGLLTSIGCQLPTALKEVNILNSVAIYPNPNNGEFTLSINLNSNNTVSASLINLVGASVKDFGVISNQITTIDATDVSTGAYYLRISNSTTSIIKKVFITK